MVTLHRHHRDCHRGRPRRRKRPRRRDGSTTRRGSPSPSSPLSLSPDRSLLCHCLHRAIHFLVDCNIMAFLPLFSCHAILVASFFVNDCYILPRRRRLRWRSLTYRSLQLCRHPSPRSSSIISLVASVSVTNDYAMREGHRLSALKIPFVRIDGKISRGSTETN